MAIYIILYSSSASLAGGLYQGFFSMNLFISSHSSCENVFEPPRYRFDPMFDEFGRAGPQSVSTMMMLRSIRPFLPDPSVFAHIE